MPSTCGEADLLIREARIVDGSGAPAYRGDIALIGDRIAEVGALQQAAARKVIDGAGLVAAPGFIDIHSHSDFTLPINPRAESKIRQGVTTEVTGQCGGSPAPLTAKNREELTSGHPHLSWEWDSFSEFLARLRENGIALNVFPLVGHGTVRTACMGASDAAPTDKELGQMREMIARAMDEGARGLSSGLIYPPGCFAATEELVALARVAAERSGFYFTHIRGEEEDLHQSVDEALRVGEEAGIPVQIAHFKVKGRENWHLLEPALEKLVRARENGVEVTADRYPYTASSTGLAAVLPNWVHEGGKDKLLERLQSSDTRRWILDELHDSAVSWDKVLISEAPGLEAYEGLSVADVAAEEGRDPAAQALDILRTAEGRVAAIYFRMDEDNLRTVLSHPAVMIGSDGSARIPEGPLGEGKHHPRNYGTFPRVLSQYTRAENVLSLEEAVHKMSGMPAEKLGLSDRGLLKAGYRADLVLFEPESVQDRATFAAPYQYPTGIEYVWVNGREVITPDGHTGDLPGRILC